MKVGIWLENIPETLGGGYSLTERFIRLIDKYDFHKDIKIVYISERTNHLNVFSKELIKIKYPKLIYFIYLVLSKLIDLIIFSSIKSELRRNIRRKTLDIYLTKLLEVQKVDLIYYPLQTFCRLPDFPFIASNWDIGHRSCFAFPEFHTKDMTETRNLFYDHIIYKALAVIVESEAGKAELVKYSNIQTQKIRVVHLFSGQSIICKQNLGVLPKYNLKTSKYFFYPAQFWPHKNHYNLIYSFKSIVDKFPELRFVFTGFDMGNETYLKKIVKNLNINDKILFLGHVNMEDIAALYANATALVMPTFLGPTNMPLLEARELGCPVLCSDIPGHREELGEGALYFNPYDIESIKICMEKILNPQVRCFLLTKAEEEKRKTLFTESTALKEFENVLFDIEKYRKCWDKNSDLIIYKK